MKTLSFFLLCIGSLVLASQSAKTAAPILFKDAQFSVSNENDIVYAKGKIAGGEMDLLLDLYKPEGANVPKLKPAVILVHGGGFRNGDRRSPIVAGLAKDMAARGYVSVSINYRLLKNKPVEEGPFKESAKPEVEEALAKHVREGKGDDPRMTEFTADEMASGRSAAAVDSKKALDWVLANASRYGIDPNRIAIGGASAGGIATLNLVYGSKEALAPRLVIDMWGRLDPPYLARMEAKDASFLIIHGTKDDLVDIQSAKDLVVRADQVGLNYRFLPIEGAGHGVPLSKEVNGKTLYQHIADFAYEELDLKNLRP